MTKFDAIYYLSFVYFHSPISTNFGDCKFSTMLLEAKYESFKNIKSSEFQRFPLENSVVKNSISFKMVSTQKIKGNILIKSLRSRMFYFHYEIYTKNAQCTNYYLTVRAVNAVCAATIQRSFRVSGGPITSKAVKINLYFSKLIEKIACSLNLVQNLSAI